MAKFIKELKDDIFNKNRDEQAVKVLPLMHVALYLLTYYKYKD